MKQMLFSLVVMTAAMAGPGAIAAEQLPALDIPEHGLGLLLETPDAPVSDIYNERSVLT